MLKVVRVCTGQSMINGVGTDPGRKFYKKRRMPLKAMVIHRITLRDYKKCPVADSALDGEVLARVFGDDALGTGGLQPYAFVMLHSGEIQQCAEIDDVTPHAYMANPYSLSTAIVGDFRVEEIDDRRRRALVWWCALWGSIGLEIVGHDELAMGSRHKDKQCPGKLADMPSIRALAKKHPWGRLPPADAERYLKAFGVFFPQD